MSKRWEIWIGAIGGILWEPVETGEFGEVYSLTTEPPPCTSVLKEGFLALGRPSDAPPSGGATLARAWTRRLVRSYARQSVDAASGS